MPTSTPHLLGRFRGGLLGTAVGDALGAPFEGRSAPSPDEVAAVEDSRDPLRWTDDTHMTIGVAESLLACGGFDGSDMARRFAEHHAREPWRGYGAGPPQIFAALRAGATWNAPAQELFGGTGSYGNGGAMRAAPAGLLRNRNPDAAARLARSCASVTHAHELGLQGAALQAAAVAWVTNGPPPESWAGGEALVEGVRGVAPSPELSQQLDALLRLPPGARPGQAAAVLGNGITAVEAVPAALWAFLRSPRSFPDVLRAAVMLGGDTDTIAAMAGALAGAFLGVDAIPPGWLQRLEARDHLTDLADRLHELASRPSSATPPD